MSYDILQPNAVTTSVLPLSTSTQHSLGIDSKSLKIQAKTPDGVSGAFAKCTFTNINGTYGNQKIGKIVATFSDLKPVTGNGSHNTDANNLSDVEIYFDPSDGFWFNNASQIHVNYQYYDENGNVINLNNDAYLTVASLNNDQWGTVHPGWQGSHVESVTLTSSGKAIALQGSTVQAQGNTLVSPHDNEPNEHGDPDWDKTGSPIEYFGAGLFQLDGNNVGLTFTTQRSGGDGTMSTWVNMSTTLPKTPTPPHDDHISANYWYDQADLPNASAEWHLTDINSVPEDKKGVEAGATDGSTQSIDGDGCFLG